ncbi:MAG: TlpA family protein disulfide reductase [Bacteroidota bacterium]
MPKFLITMKNYFLLFLLAPLFSAGQGLKIQPQNPQAGELLRVEIDFSASAAAGAENAVLGILEYADGKVQAVDAALSRTGNTITGIFTLSADSKALMLYVEDPDKDDVYDNNKKQGYFVSIHDKQGKVLPESLGAQATLLQLYGGLAGLDKNPARVLEWLNEGIRQKPEVKAWYCMALLNATSALYGGDKGTGQVEALTAELDKLSGISEADLLMLVKFYERAKQSDRADNTKKKIRAQYPKGTLVRQDARTAIEMEADLARAEVLASDYIRNYPAATDKEIQETNGIYTMLAGKYGDQGNWEKMYSIADKASAPARASMYNNFAWELAQKGESLDEAMKMASIATEISRAEINTPSPGSRPSPYMNARAWARQREYNFAMYADTYAYILGAKGEHSKAARLQEKVIGINKGSDADMNERYVSYLEKAADPSLRYKLEEFILKGQATNGMKDMLKRQYLAEDHSENGAAAYVSRLEQAAKAAKKEEMLRNMGNDPAPAFSLLNMSGETVSLAALKGKVVIVDFWATWCGPCKASFPGMQKAVNLYKDDAGVAFVFVDCWERGADKLKIATDFINSKGYTFNVLIDQDDKVVSSFGVSGIPTKFVIDPAGRIAFKAVGYDGSEDGLVEEMQAMIEAARSRAN